MSCQNCSNGCACDRATSLQEGCTGKCACGMTAKEAGCDTLSDIFSRQMEFMDMLVMADKLPEYPIDITTKQGQRMLKEINGELVGELYEAMYILKNKMHRFTDHTDVDFEHFKEELGDALAYFVEICVMAGITPEELYAEYCRKNAFVKKRAREGY